jgi:hypothetical protein
MKFSYSVRHGTLTCNMSDKFSKFSKNKSCKSKRRSHILVISQLCGQLRGHSTKSMARIQALKQWPLPSSAKELKIFLGGINFYHKFIPSFSNLARPLHQLANTSSTFIWNKEETSHFAQLKDALYSSPFLHLLDFSQPFEIESDASQYATSVILKQEDTPLLTTLKPCLRQRIIIVPMTRNFIVWCKHSNNGGIISWVKKPFRIQTTTL